MHFKGFIRASAQALCFMACLYRSCTAPAVGACPYRALLGNVYLGARASAAIGIELILPEYSGFSREGLISGQSG